MTQTPQSQRIATPLLGFLTVEKLGAPSAYIGAWMVTDERGYPLEFKATTPVRPTPVQQVLYGNGLERYVSVELCGRKLVAEAVRKPSVVVVSTSTLLGVTDSSTPTMIFIRRAGEAIIIGDETSRRQSGRIESGEGYFQPLIYEASFSSSEERESTVGLLTLCSSQFDIIEVFERMRAAAEMLAKEDPRYRP